MTNQELKTRLDTTNLPVAYYAFKTQTALPFICYLEADSDNFGADGIMYQAIPRWDVELYCAKRDTTVEASVEAALDGLFWQKSIMYLDDEKCYQILYTFEDLGG